MILALFAASFLQQVATTHTTAQGLPADDVVSFARGPADALYAVTTKGAARFDGTRWTVVKDVPQAKMPAVDLPTRVGIPVDSVTSVAKAADGSYWAGTKRGALRFVDGRWEYRQGRRWLPDDDVRAVATLGTRAFFATSKGVGVIDAVPVTFAEKASRFESAIDKYHRRTPYQYVHSVVTGKPGDPAEFKQTDSDNDGLWTAMYGAGECYACAANVPGACERAKRAFEALRFLGTVTQGGSHPAPKGFVARTILPADGPDPNLSYTPERDAEFQKTREALWKVMRPRWPKSADGKWYWKADTSSDELDGHFYFYGLYYDLVAKTEADRSAVREHVAAMAGHLVDHGFRYIDHDGKVTRWGVFDPASLNGSTDWWEERGLNSISILSYLKTAEHITGERRFADAARELREKHHYDMNALIPKSAGGPGSGNQSDDEMAFMCLHNLLRYETDDRLRRIYALALRQRWEIEEPERNPFFNFVAAVSLKGTEWLEPPRRQSLALEGSRWMEDSLDTLRRFPLDRFNWAQQNSHRKDMAPSLGGRGRLRGTHVLPIDERFVEYWNHDPWELDTGGDGRRLADGAAYLLPYYMGLYHGFIER